MHIIPCVFTLSVIFLVAVVIFPGTFCLLPLGNGSTRTDSSTTTRKSNILVPLEAVNSNELRERLENPEIRFLILDRRCKTLDQRHIKLRFLMTKEFTANNQNESRNCWVELKKSGKVSKSLWSPNGEIKVLIHGFVRQFWNDADEVINAQHIFELGEEYGRHKDDLNVIIVDWTYLAAIGSYPAAAFSTRRTGVIVAEFLMKLHRKNNLTMADWDKVHLIGFSLGAHVSGIAGYQLQQLGAVKVGRITGLDPTGPEFDGPNGNLPEDVSTFLDKSDAQFVDIIHCNMGRSSSWILSAALGRFGSWVQSGHADFYPNGGHHQPRFCNTPRNKKGCSHNICVPFYIHTIQNSTRLACHCDTWWKFKNGYCSPCDNNGKDGTLMGDPCDKTASGKYYLAIHKAHRNETKHS